MRLFLHEDITPLNYLNCYAALPNTAHTSAESQPFRGRYCHFYVINKTQIPAQAMEALLPIPERSRSHLLDVFLLKPAEAHAALATPGLISEGCLPAQSEQDSSASIFSDSQSFPLQNWEIAARPSCSFNSTSSFVLCFENAPLLAAAGTQAAPCFCRQQPLSHNYPSYASAPVSLHCVVSPFLPWFSPGLSSGLSDNENHVRVKCNLQTRKPVSCALSEGSKMLTVHHLSLQIGSDSFNCCWD